MYKFRLYDAFTTPPSVTSLVRALHSHAQSLTHLIELEYHATGQQLSALHASEHVHTDKKKVITVVHASSYQRLYIINLILRR